MKLTTTIGYAAALACAWPLPPATEAELLAAWRGERGEGPGEAPPYA